MAITKTRLAVILHVDIAGSTQLMRMNTGLAHQRIQQTFDNLGGYARDFSGSIREQRGDALLVEFNRGSDAVVAALLFLENHRQFTGSLNDDIIPEVRIGIAMGEVIVADGTISGAGVVLAQRLEQLGQPGDIILQSAVKETVPDELEINFKELGLQVLQGFDNPVVAYRANHPDSDQMVRLKSRQTKIQPVFSPRDILKWKVPLLLFAGVLLGIALFYGQRQSNLLPSAEQDSGIVSSERNKASTEVPHAVTVDGSLPVVAILPFTDKGEQHEALYLSDGLTEDIISAMSKFSTLYVMSWNAVSMFSSRDSTLGDINQAIEVDYLVTGSMRHQNHNLTFHIEMSQVDTGHIVWSDRYQDTEEKLFYLRDQIANDIAARLSVTMDEHEFRGIVSGSSANFDNYKLVLRARLLLRKRTRKDLGIARELLRKAIDREPALTPAYAELAWSYIEEYQNGWSEWPERTLSRAHELLTDSISKDDYNARTHSMLARLLIYLERPDQARSSASRALVLNPNDPEVHATRGYVEVFTGRSPSGIEYLEYALKFDPYVTPVINNLGVAYYLSGRTEEAIQMLERATGQAGESAVYANVFLLLAYSKIGRTDLARKTASIVKQNYPFFSVNEFSQIPMIASETQRQIISVALREAGLE